MTESKQLVYRYEGDPKSEETEEDLEGDAAVPSKDAVIARKGKRWRVVAVNKEQLLARPPAIPVYRIFLTEVH